VVMLALNTLAVPVAVLAMLGFVPFKLIVVPLNVTVDELEPILNVPAAPPRFNVPVRPVLNNASVPLVTLVAIVGLFIVSVPALDDPIPNVVAAPNALTVVDVVFAILAVAADVTRSCSVSVESTVAVPYILVPDSSFAMLVVHIVTYA